MSFKLTPHAIHTIMQAVLNGEYNEFGFTVVEGLLNDAELVSHVNNVLLRFGYELKPIELKHDAIAPQNPNAVKYNFTAHVKIKDFPLCMFKGMSKALILEEINNLYGDKLELVKFVEH